MRRVDLRFDVGDAVQVPAEGSFGGVEYISGNVFAAVRRHNEDEYVIETPKGRYQMPFAVVSYFNSEKSPNREGNVSGAEALPELNEEVLVRDLANRPQVMRLQLNTSGIMSDSGYMVPSLGFRCQGLLSISDCKSWRTVPE